jgi:glycosyltransferase domain-containing protein
LVEFLRAGGLAGNIIVADSSDLGAIEPYTAAFARLSADLRSFDPATPFYDKLDAALALVDTPFVTQMTDDDIPLPNAVRDCHDFLIDHDEYSIAWGYALDFGLEGTQFDVHNLQWSTASIEEDSPLERLYHSVRRYSPPFWSVARSSAMQRSISWAKSPARTVFQEMTTILTLAMQGKIARLPMIHVLRGPALSQSNRSEIHPMFALLDGPGAFFTEYAAYRDRLIAFARVHEIPLDTTPSATIEHVLDLIHMIGLARELDGGMLNYTVQRLLGASYPDIPHVSSWPGWRKPAEGDIVHASSDPTRRYVWRAATMQAGPGDEGYISDAMRADVERQLDLYRIPART